MNLLLDIGNSRCKFALLENSGVQEYGAIIHASKDKISATETLLRDVKPINKVVVCSVLGVEFNQQLIEVFNKHQIGEYYFLDPVVNSFGIQHCYQTPKHLGADRLAVLIAANEKYKGSKCIIDCGTAITIDGIDAMGKHLGGVILPGIKSMHAALTDDTEIHFVDTANGGERIGCFNSLSNSTQDAIYTGCLSAVVGGIEYVVNAMQKQSNLFDKIIITGGDAGIILPKINLKIEHIPTLVLDGLGVVLKKL